MSTTAIPSVPVRTPASPRTETEQKLMTAQDLFIRRWGEMGATWGINRTQAEIHALLYITAQPLCTDDVMERLHISRGNASMSLRALCDWGIIRRLHKRGERREYFKVKIHDIIVGNWGKYAGYPKDETNIKNI